MLTVDSCSDRGGGGGGGDDAVMFHTPHCDCIAIPFLLYATMNFNHLRKKLKSMTQPLIVICELMLRCVADIFSLIF